MPPTGFARKLAGIPPSRRRPEALGAEIPRTDHGTHNAMLENWQRKLLFLFI
jgi:hypothetical protein